MLFFFLCDELCTLSSIKLKFEPWPLQIVSLELWAPAHPGSRARTRHDGGVNDERIPLCQFSSTIFLVAYFDVTWLCQGSNELIIGRSSSCNMILDYRYAPLSVAVGDAFDHSIIVFVIYLFLILLIDSLIKLKKSFELTRKHRIVGCFK